MTWRLTSGIWTYKCQLPSLCEFSTYFEWPNRILTIVHQSLTVAPLFRSFRKPCRHRHIFKSVPSSYLHISPLVSMIVSGLALMFLYERSTSKYCRRIFSTWNMATYCISIRRFLSPLLGVLRYRGYKAGFPVLLGNTDTKELRSYQERGILSDTSLTCGHTKPYRTTGLVINGGLALVFWRFWRNIFTMDSCRVLPDFFRHCIGEPFFAGCLCLPKHPVKVLA